MEKLGVELWVVGAGGRVQEGRDLGPEGQQAAGALGLGHRPCKGFYHTKSRYEAAG